MKKQVQAALYLLADGTQAFPRDCEPDVDGVLRHIYGMPVALHEDGSPVTIGRAAEENMNVEAAQAGEGAVAEAAQINADSDRVERPAEPVETLIDPATGEVASETAAISTPAAEPFGGKGDHDGNGVIGGAKKPDDKDVQAAPAKRAYKTREAKAR